MYSAGTTLKVDFGSFFHYGIADGLGQVIHNSKKRMKVTLESYEDFSGGKEITVSNITSINPENAVNRAMQYIGMPYNLLRSNCEHFARLCHGLENESPQIQKWMLISVGSVAVLKSKDPILQAAGGGMAIGSLLTPKETSPYKNASVGTLIGALIGLMAKIWK